MQEEAILPMADLVKKACVKFGLPAVTQFKLFIVEFSSLPAMQQVNFN